MVSASAAPVNTNEKAAPAAKERQTPQVTAAERSTTSVGDVVLGLLLFPLMLTGCSKSGPKPVAPNTLSPSEKEAMFSLLRNIYKDVLGADKEEMFFYHETVYFDIKLKKKIEPPLETTSVVIIGYILPQQEADIKAKIGKWLDELHVEWDENGVKKSLKLVQYSIEITIEDSGMGGGMFSMPKSKVVVMPEQVLIK